MRNHGKYCDCLLFRSLGALSIEGVVNASCRASPFHWCCAFHGHVVKSFVHAVTRVTLCMSCAFRDGRSKHESPWLETNHGLWTPSPLAAKRVEGNADRLPVIQRVAEAPGGHGAPAFKAGGAGSHFDAGRQSAGDGCYESCASIELLVVLVERFQKC
jgi:hypothetical protein